MKNKIKTKKSFSKRVKATKKTFVRKKANKGHLLRKKNSARKRRISHVNRLSLVQSKLAKKLIHS